MGNHLRLLGLFLLQSIAGGEGKRKMTSKGDLEATVAAAYVDRGLVTAKSVSVGGEKVEYLEAGPADAGTPAPTSFVANRDWGEISRFTLQRALCAYPWRNRRPLNHSSKSGRPSLQ